MTKVILEELPTFFNASDPMDEDYTPPHLQSFWPDHSLLLRLRSLKLPVVEGPTVSEKIMGSENDKLVLSKVWEAQAAQEDWPAFISLISRDEPDERNMRVTYLPNEDTIAILLAIRLGLETEVAIALAYQDLIYFGELNANEAGYLPRYQDSVLLGTFLAKNTGLQMALYARARAAMFSTHFKRHELILLRETEERELSHEVNEHFAVLLKDRLHCRTDEIVWVQSDEEVSS